MTPATKAERDAALCVKLLAEFKERQRVRAQTEKDEAQRLKGYRFWCSEGCGFVDRYHQCEQWASLTYVSPTLFAAIRKEKVR